MHQLVLSLGAKLVCGAVAGVIGTTMYVQFLSLRLKAEGAGYDSNTLHGNEQNIPNRYSQDSASESCAGDSLQVGA